MNFSYPPFGGYFKLFCDDNDNFDKNSVFCYAKRSLHAYPVSSKKAYRTHRFRGLFAGLRGHR